VEDIRQNRIVAMHNQVASQMCNNTDQPHIPTKSEGGHPADKDLYAIKMTEGKEAPRHDQNKDD